MTNFTLPAPAIGIGCERCLPSGGRGYYLDTDRDRKKPHAEVAVCACVEPLCVCGAVRPRRMLEPNEVPSWEALPNRAGEAIYEHECACWPVRQLVGQINRNLRRAGIDDIYEGKTIADWKTFTPDGGPIPEAAGVPQSVRGWVQGVVSGEEAKGLFLYGPPGDGKTLLACAALTELIIRTGRPGKFLDVGDFFERLRRTYDDRARNAGDRSQETTSQAWGDLANIRWLVLDDLGIEQGTAWQREQLFRLINKRYKKRRHTIITTNRTADELIAPITSAEDRLPSIRISTRINHMCRALKLPDLNLREVFYYGT